MTSYSTLHNRLRRQRGPAKNQVCVTCGNQAQEWAQIQGTDGESLDDYQAMCCSCHQKYDNHWNEETKAKVAKAVSDRWKDPEYSARVGAAISAARAKNGLKIRGEI